MDASGANAISVAPGANGYVNAREAADTVSELSPEVVLTQLETPTEVVRKLVSCRLSGTTYVLNAAPLDGESVGLASCVDILIVNVVEASILAGHIVVSSNAVEIAGELAVRQTRGCAITLGNAGVAAVLDGAEHRLEPHPVEVVDTTGAGDAFCGALAAGLVSGLTSVDALAWGNAAGALATTHASAQPSMPTAGKIRALLSETLA